jgi:hypothetical protein
VNVAEGVFYCKACEEAFLLADYLKHDDVPNRTEKPPYSKIEHFIKPGSMAIKTPPGGFRSALFFLLFSTFWNAISWTIFLSMLNQEGMDWFEILFILPFLLIGLGTFFVSLYQWRGRFYLYMDHHQAIGVWTVFGLKYKKIIAVEDIATVTQHVAYSKNYQPVYGVCISTNKNKKMIFGTTLSEDERFWIIGEINYFLTTIRRP